MGEYVPHPADTSDVVLPSELDPLVEALAENVHETWAKGRMDGGWRYGEVRDDGRRLHPCLVPYAALPESERAFDRATALETLRFVVSSGFEIRPQPLRRG